MSVLKDLVKDFAKGVASGAGEKVGGTIADAVLGVLGLGGESGPDYTQKFDQLHQDLQKIDQDLLVISGQLNAIDLDLQKISDNQHEQILQASLKIWSDHNCQKYIAVIQAYWGDVVANTKNTTLWVKDVLSEPTDVMHRMRDIHSAVRSGDSSPLKLYADFIINQVKYQFPVTAPWQPSLRFYNYCNHLLYQYWCAAVMAKAAHVQKNEFDLANNCVNDYLKKVKEFEAEAFVHLVRVLEAVNNWVHEMGGSFPMLYEPFFTVEDFQFLDIFDEQEKLQGTAWKDMSTRTFIASDPEIVELIKNHKMTNDIWTRKQKKYSEELFNSNLGKDIENFESLMAAYRPVEKVDQVGGRITIFLSYWDDFYQKHRSAQQLRGIEILSVSGHSTQVKDSDILSTNLELFVSGDLQNQGLPGVQMYGQDIEIGGVKLDAKHLSKLFVFGNPNVMFMRWTYFVPFGTYRVDAGDRLKWQYGTDVYTFMGKSNYATEGVTITETDPAKIMRWSPWDGAFLMANDPEGKVEIIK